MSPQVISRKSIVLVEDNPADVVLIRRALKEHGIECALEVIADGETALKHLAGLDLRSDGVPVPDMIVLDLNLPRRDGIEVLESCQRTPTLAGVPILVLTSSESPDERRRIEELGAGYVRKPLLLDDFMAVGGRIRELLDGAAA